MSQTYQRSAYLSLVYNIFSLKKEDKWKPYHVTGTGTHSALSLILDVHQTDILGSERGHFVIAANSFFDEFDTPQVLRFTLDTEQMSR